MIEQCLTELAGAHEAIAGSPSMYGWVLKNGRRFDSSALSSAEWKHAERTVRYTLIRECFANCQRSVLEPQFRSIHQIASKEVRVDTPFEYVEGYVIDQVVPIPVLHAWLSINGKVVDPTFRARKRFRRKRFPHLVFGTVPSGRSYYGAAIGWEKVATCVIRNLAWHTVLDDWTHGYPLLREAACG